MRFDVPSSIDFISEAANIFKMPVLKPTMNIFPERAI